MNSGIELELKIKKITDIKLDTNVGSFVFVQASDKSGQLYFQDALNHRLTLDRVYGLTTEWNAESGNKDLPKPYVVDAQDNILENGDNILYTYMGGSDGNVAILGSLQNLLFNNFDENLNTDSTSLDDIKIKALSRNNKKRYLLVTDDTKGDLTIYLQGKGSGDTAGTGNVTLKVSGTDGNGNAKLEVNGKIAIQQVQADDNENEIVTAQLLMDNKKGAEKIKLIDKYKNQLTMSKDGIDVLDANNNEIKTTSSGITINAASDCTVNAKNVVITGGELTVDGNATPTGSGAFNCLPQCIFSGAIHTGNKVSGT